MSRKYSSHTQAFTQLARTKKSLSSGSALTSIDVFLVCDRDRCPVASDSVRMPGNVSLSVRGRARHEDQGTNPRSICDERSFRA